VVICTCSQFETEDIGRRIGPLLKKGSFVALTGELGGGKTCFVRGVVKCVSPESAHLVASPTFAIMNEYPGTIPIYHFDMYRLSGGPEIIELGFEDYFTGEGICIVEWSERLLDIIPDDRLDIRFEHAGDDKRSISIEAIGPKSENMLRQLESLTETT
jgi:tRNA threonylcarbamoyladenosine biosynthesis protein TsaE